MSHTDSNHGKKIDKKLGYRRDSARRRPLRRSRSFKVTDYGIIRKPAWDWLLVNNTSLHPILKRSQIIADYWSNMRFRQGGGYVSETVPWYKLFGRGKGEGVIGLENVLDADARPPRHKLRPTVNIICLA